MQPQIHVICSNILIFWTILAKLSFLQLSSAPQYKTVVPICGWFLYDGGSNTKVIFIAKASIVAVYHSYISRSRCTKC